MNTSKLIFVRAYPSVTSALIFVSLLVTTSEALEALKKTRQTIEDGTQLTQYYVGTERWLSSIDHENAVLLDISKIGGDATLLKGLQQLYPNKSDIIGARLVDNGDYVNIVFARKELQQDALCNGLRISKTTTVYPTKTLSSDRMYTLLTINELPIQTKEATASVIAATIDSIVQTHTRRINAAREATTNHNAYDETEQHWPPTIDHIQFHQYPAGFYQGTVTVVLQGTLTRALVKRRLPIIEYNTSYPCKVEYVSLYCSHCQRRNHHKAANCPVAKTKWFSF